MKKLILATVLLLNCSDVQNNGINDTFDTASRIDDRGGGAHIIDPDAGLDLVNKIPDKNYVYACAMTYVQIPYINTDPETSIEIEMYSHQLWSMPVKRYEESNGFWIAFGEHHGEAPPWVNNADFYADSNEENTAYANIILADGTELYDQLVRPGKRTNENNQREWQVCETYSCGPNGCQTYPQFQSEDWKCQSLFNDEDLDKCPCIFNDSGYTYCDLNHGQEEETETNDSP
jgi:hypothetical protein